MNKHLNNKMLLKLVKRSLLVLITLFSVIPCVVDAYAGFEYKDFDWETFRKDNYYYWGDACFKNGDDLSASEREDCNDEILKNEEQFYTKLYKILAEIQEEGEDEGKNFKINDDIILQTIYYGMNPDYHKDTVNDYNNRYETVSGKGNYSMDETESSSEPNVDTKVKISFWGSIVDAIKNFFTGGGDSAPEGGYTGDYFEEETDSLKTLIHSMFAYDTVCYCTIGEAEKVTVNGETQYTCENVGGTYHYFGWSLFENSIDIGLRGTSGHKCVDEFNYHLPYYVYFTSKWDHQWYPMQGEDKLSSFFGQVPVDEGFEQCKMLDPTYEGGCRYEFLDDTKEVDTEVYFDFLKLTRYFDRKAHLQFAFQNVLSRAKVDCLTSNVCENSLEALGEEAYAKYESTLIRDRLHIIEQIIDNLRMLGEDVDYLGLGEGSFVEMNEQEADRRSYYWPIGSDETESRDGIVFADGEPASKTIIRKFGNNFSDALDTENFHYGIDIAGVDGVTNVISVSAGEVVTVINTCTSGDVNCNEGYGNQIIVASPNGDYIVYGHLSDVFVHVGDNLQKGQLIAHVGITGETLEPCVHWEIRVGGNSTLNAVNPSLTSDPSDPRPAGASGDFSIRTTSLTRDEFIQKMAIYCNTHSCSSDMITYFVNRAGDVYDYSKKYNLNPEFVVVRAMAEGFSPGGTTYNFWGINCTNGSSASHCNNYGSLEAGIQGLSKVGAVAKAQTALEVMQNGYAYIGRYWFNPGSWSLGGCKYYPSINKYMSGSRSSVVSTYCNSSQACNSDGSGHCLPTTSEDQTAYVTWQLNNKMVPYRYNVFGL